MEGILEGFSWLRFAGFVLQVGCFWLIFESKRALNRVEKKVFADFFLHLSVCALAALVWEVLNNVAVDPLDPSTKLPRIYNFAGLIGGWLLSWGLFSLLSFLVPLRSSPKDRRGERGKK